jgi:hypothetical protein
MTNPPAPLEWHPAYRDKTWLIDWLNSRDGIYFRVPIIPELSVNSLEQIKDHEILTKQQAAGPAPYVGDPFIYVWFFVTDNLNRSIAGESWIEYLPNEPWRS